MRTRRVFAHVGLTAGALIMLYPLLWMITASFRPNTEIFKDAGLVPEHPTLGNYALGWHSTGVNFGVYIANSLIICTAVVIGNVLTCSLTAYAFARLKFIGRKTLFALMLATIMLPGHVTLIAQYSIFRNLNWIDTFWPMIVPSFLATDAFFVFLMVQFIRSIPVELDDAARIDGCGAWGIYRRIILPLLTPALVTTAIFSFIWTWNNFFSQLIYLSTRTKLTVPVALRGFLDSTGSSEWGALFAMSVVTLVPVVVVFVVFQRRILAGMAHTGLK
ncbi:carbohydrate ABC transporter permease [Kribbella pittospori]|uniref:Carbohydrate ABC transporter permease n=1 Tax=Kribbella pittospori TaxID=722689 RepID=A0A4R0KD38_9ACTN|nr:carbohydrate ABC transporter permease [Kribbella pittospori]TCC57600.1 carbohydrate ABC transporter permease [Kribbella pittospori]